MAAVAARGSAPAAVGFNPVGEDGDAGAVSPVPCGRRGGSAEVPLIGVTLGSAAAPLVAALICVELLTTTLCRLVATCQPLLVVVFQQCQANLGVRKLLTMHWIKIPRLIQRVHEGTHGRVGDARQQVTCGDELDAWASQVGSKLNC